METRIHRNTKGERVLGEVIRELTGGAFLVRSFSDSTKTYKTHVDSRYCSCPHNSETERFCKHLATAQVIANIRALPFGARIAEARMMELCQRLYAPVSRNESFTVSYYLLLDVLSNRHSTEAMVAAAVRRHGRILLMHETGPRRAA